MIGVAQDSGTIQELDAKVRALNFVVVEKEAYTSVTDVVTIYRWSRNGK